MLYKRIRDLREDADKTQSELASYLNTTAQYYGKYESGEREIPFSRAIRLADYYNVSIDYLAGRTDELNISTCVCNEEERRLIRLYRMLSERNRGKMELFIEQLLRHQ